MPLDYLFAVGFAVAKDVVMHRSDRPEKHDTEPAEVGGKELEGLPDHAGAERCNELEPLFHLVVVLLALDKPEALGCLIARRHRTIGLQQTALAVDGAFVQSEDCNQLHVGLPQGQGNEPQGECLANGQVEQAVVSIHDGRVDGQIDVRAEDAVPLENVLEKRERVELVTQDFGGEGGDPTQRMDEEGIGCEVLIKRILLIFDGLRAEVPDDATDLSCWALHGRDLRLTD